MKELMEAFEDAFGDRLKKTSEFSDPFFRKLLYEEALAENPAIVTGEDTINVFRAEETLKRLLDLEPEQLAQRADSREPGQKRRSIEPPEVMYSALRHKFIDGVKSRGFDVPLRLRLSTEAMSPFIRDAMKRWVLRLPSEPFIEHGFRFFDTGEEGTILALGPNGLVIPPDRIEARPPAKGSGAAGRAFRNLGQEGIA